MEILILIGFLSVWGFLSFFSGYNKWEETLDTFDKFVNKLEILDYLLDIGIIDREANVVRRPSNKDISLIRDKFPVSWEEILEVISQGKNIAITRKITKRPPVVKRNRVEAWGENGKKESELQYLNGVLDGPAVWWHPNGVMRAQASFVKGELLPGYREWNEEGRPVYEEHEEAAVQEEPDVARHETPSRAVESKKDAASVYAAKSGGPDKTFYSKIAGVTYNNDNGVSRQQIIQKMKPGEKLTFAREPGNPYDSNAIAVYNKKGEKAGYIRKELARDMAGKMDSESSIYEGIVAEVTEGSDYGVSGSIYGVNIRIEERSFIEKEHVAISNDEQNSKGDVTRSQRYKDDQRYSEIVDMIENTVIDYLGNSEDIHGEDLSFDEHFGMDSLDLVEIVMVLEEIYGQDIPDDDAEKIRTIGDAAEYIYRQLYGDMAKDEKDNANTNTNNIEILLEDKFNSKQSEEIQQGLCLSGRERAIDNKTTIDKADDENAEKTQEADDECRARNKRSFDYLQIGLAPPDRILSWSHGEVEKPETINYRTFKPERKGLFCEKIFGPVNDGECYCGRYRNVKEKGIICERCGVEVTTASVRRERMGHIRLCVPVTHIWFLRSIPGYISLLLDIPSFELDKVIYYDSYIVTEVSDDIKNKVKIGEILDEGTYQELKDKYGNSFKADTGASPIRDLLSRMDINDTVNSLREALKDTSEQKRIKTIGRLRVAEAFLESGNRPEWMILDVIPVMPPELRPMVQLEGGRFATSDLNDLYRRVLNRNNRIKKMIAVGASSMIIRNEKRMLQESVDALIDNGGLICPVTGSTGRPLKSLTDIVDVSQGRFGQNLLGKRVDYSGRSVIVVGPHLKMHQCGLPKVMALELFKPFVIRKLVEKGLSQNVKSAKRQIERKDIVIWDILEEVIQGQVVLLNRAPTLHRLGIQAFEPVLVEGKAIQIPPLVCTAFNADFDGDQMAVHVPLLPEAQVEARVIMLSSHNLMSPASGRPVMTPSQDMILGTYYMTYMDETDTEEPKLTFSGDDEAMLAHDCEEIHMNNPIKVMRNGEIIKTTAGRVEFNYTLNSVIKRMGATGPLPYMNYSFDKKKVEKLITDCYKQFGSTVTAEIADEIKRLGFKYATLAGISISVEDLKVPKRKKEIIEKAEKQIDHLRKLEKNKSITSKEKSNKTMEIWSDVTQNVTQELVDEFKLDPLNSVYLMAYSGARGSMAQVRQLSGIRGLMADKEGDIHPIPIKSNFKEGLNVTEYFISSYGARKGLVDTALRTADSGYLTRRLVDVGQDVMITAEDCGTKSGLLVASIWDGSDEILTLRARIVGRNSAQKVSDPISGKIIVNVGQEITDEIADKIAEAGIEAVKVRSPLTCGMKKDICQMCYGRNLATGNPIDIGEAVGIIAAQSIGEPCTQLIMRTFHTGGVALHKMARVTAKHAGKVSFGEELSIRTIMDVFDNKIEVVTRESFIAVKSKNREEWYPMQVGSIIKVSDGESVKTGAVIAEIDSTYDYVMVTTGGKVKFFGFDFIERKKKVEDKTVIEILAENEGMAFVYNPKVVKEYDVPKGAKIIVKLGDNVDFGTELASGVTAKGPGVVIDVEENSMGWSVVTAQGEFCRIQSGAQLMVNNGDLVDDYDIIAREVVSDTKKTTDIIQGLPKLEGLFEARRPNDAALISEIDGKVDFIDKEGGRQILIEGNDEKVEYLVPYDTRLRVSKGDKVRKGADLTYGEPNPHDYLRILGAEAAQKLIVNEVQKICCSQGMTIHDKHVETVVRQMTNKVRIVTPGESPLLSGELLGKIEFDKIYETTKGEKPTATKVLLGISKTSLLTDSFISAAAFQETASILADAAVKGKVDEMYGLKENVIIGRLIPSGTGFSGCRYVESESAYSNCAYQNDASQIDSEDTDSECPSSDQRDL